MSDCVEDSNDKSPDSQNSKGANACFAVIDAQSRSERNDIFQQDDDRKLRSLDQLKDEFGQCVILGESSFRDRGTTFDTKLAEATQKHEATNHGIEMKGEEWGQKDIGGLSALHANMSNVPHCSAPKALFELDKAELAGAERSEEMGGALRDRNGDDSAEGHIRNQLSSVKEGKALALNARDDREGDGDKESETAGGGGKTKSKHKSDDAVMKFLLDGEDKDPQTTKDLADWADARVAAANLSDADLAESSMNDLVAMAEKGNPFARGLLGSCIVAGDPVAEETWLQTRRSEQQASGLKDWRNFIPSLPSHLADKIKSQAARALVDIGKGSLTRAEQLALAIGLGHAFNRAEAGDSSLANRSLLQTAADHFVRVLTKKEKRSARSGDQRKQRRTALGAVFDAIKGGVPGVKHLTKFISQATGVDARVGKGAKKRQMSDVYVRPPGHVPGPDSAPPTVDSSFEMAASVETGEETDNEGDVPGVGASADATGVPTDVHVAASHGLNALVAGEALKPNADVHSVLDAHQAIGDRLYSQSGRYSIQRDVKQNVITAGDVLSGRTQQHIGKMSRESSLTWQLGSRKTLTITDSQTLVKLDSGRLFDPMTNKFFKREAGAVVETTEPPTETERNQLANLRASEHLRDLMRSHLILLLNASLHATQFFQSANMRGATFVRRPKPLVSPHTAPPFAGVSSADNNVSPHTVASSGVEQKIPLRTSLPDISLTGPTASVSRGSGSPMDAEIPGEAALRFRRLLETHTKSKTGHLPR